MPHSVLGVFLILVSNMYGLFTDLLAISIMFQNYIALSEIYAANHDAIINTIHAYSQNLIEELLILIGQLTKFLCHFKMPLCCHYKTPMFYL